MTDLFIGYSLLLVSTWACHCVNSNMYKTFCVYVMGPIQVLDLREFWFHSTYI